MLVLGDLPIAVSILPEFRADKCLDFFFRPSGQGTQVLRYFLSDGIGFLEGLGQIFEFIDHRVAAGQAEQLACVIEEKAVHQVVALLAIGIQKIGELRVKREVFLEFPKQPTEVLAREPYVNIVEVGRQRAGAVETIGKQEKGLEFYFETLGMICRSAEPGEDLLPTLDIVHHVSPNKIAQR